MPPTTGAELREAFLSYFETTLGQETGKPYAHKRQASASLVPASNPTVMLTPAGMLPFVPIFLGLQARPTPPRAVSSQKCARVSGKASDLEAVGRTPRHHTFFEMLGNFSFGDYFKAEVIPWAWRFLTEVVELPAERLWVSVFRDDDEAYAIWRDVVGVPEARLFRCDEKDNFWGPPGPTGPCGPCTEIHYDLTQNPDDPLEDRLMELWNLVFMEFFKDETGQLTPLEHKNVDTGMGLERITAVVQGKPNTFETDLLWPLVQDASKHSGKAYGASEATDVGLKIVADHTRFLAFALADGVVPSNEGRGYIVRMILRRAVRYGKQVLNIEQPFLASLLPTVAEHYGHAYPELNQRLNYSQTVLQREEERFLETLEKGTALLQEAIEGLKQAGQTELSGEAAFKLYDTYGFPVELSKDLLVEQGLSLDETGFEAAMQAQKELARGHQKNKLLLGSAAVGELAAELGATPFVGYNQLEVEVTVKAILIDGEPVSMVSGTNQPCQLILDKTPFYAESGGQVGDRGQLTEANGEQEGLTLLVTDTQKLGDVVLHHCLFDQGSALHVGDTLLASVEPTHRWSTMLHHSATHLLHAALRQVLGNEVSQAGSNVGPEGARFDINFSRAITADELNQIEALVNRWIAEGEESTTQEMPLDAAKKAGAMAMFDEKYGDTVRVVSFGTYSLELCGGTHVQQVGQIGLFRILSEGAIASGVRRLSFVAGPGAYRQFKQEEQELKRVASLLKVTPLEVAERVEKLQADLKARDKAMETLKQQQALQALDGLLASLNAQLQAPAVLIEQLPDGLEAEALKTLAEQLVEKAKTPAVVVLASVAQEKVVLVAQVHPTLTKQGFSAGELVKLAASQCGGGGGGKPTQAQAGGKNPAALPQALQAVRAAVEEKRVR